MVLRRVPKFPNLRRAIRFPVGRGGVSLPPFPLLSLESFLRLGALLGGCGGSVGFKLFSV